jgi:hypothetical protein
LRTSGEHCQSFISATGDGHTCTCSRDQCNSLSYGKEMVARAEFGFTGSGIKCHVCDGLGGLCTYFGDEGVSIDCGEGVGTCLLGQSSMRSCITYLHKN